LDYPSFEEEVKVVKNTTSDKTAELTPLFKAEEISEIQQLIRRVPVPDNVVEYAVNLASKTRPNNPASPDIVKEYIDWGAGPRASQNLILAGKAHALLNGKYTPDIENVQAIAMGILQHRVLKNYKAEAEGYSLKTILKELL